MRVRFRRSLPFTMAFVVSLGCSDDDGRTLPDPGPVSGVDRATPYGAASDAEVSMLCEWAAGRIGGWGRRASCGDGNYLTSAQSPTRCLADYQNADLSSCPLLVGDFEDCVNGVVEGCSSLPVVCLEFVSCVL